MAALKVRILDVLNPTTALTDSGRSISRESPKMDGGSRPQADSRDLWQFPLPQAFDMLFDKLKTGPLP